MVSHNVSEGIEPRNLSILHWAKSFTIWKPVALHAMMASVLATCRGRSPWRVIRRFTTELGRTMSFPKRSLQRAEEAKRRYDGMVVGLTHIRGVNGVMSIESQEPGTLEGVSSRTQRIEVTYAMH